MDDYGLDETGGDDYGLDETGGDDYGLDETGGDDYGLDDFGGDDPWFEYEELIELNGVSDGIDFGNSS